LKVKTMKKVLIAVVWLTLAACDEKPLVPGPGGGGNGGGAPTGPGPIATTGTISGTVTASGAGVSNARVVLGTTTTATTIASGQYMFADVPTGPQSVTLVPPSPFLLADSETSTKSTTVTAGQTATVNWTLFRSPLEVKTVTWVVSLLATRFSPALLTIARRDNVLWLNEVPVFHTISPDDRNQPGAWRTENMNRGGDTFSHRFDVEGTFHYRCTIHAGMTGVVTVR
jgi:plastocyanin